MLALQSDPKKEKAAEPGREALAAFIYCKAARVACFPVSPSRSARIKLFDKRGLVLEIRRFPVSKDTTIAVIPAGPRLRGSAGYRFALNT